MRGESRRGATLWSWLGRLWRLSSALRSHLGRPPNPCDRLRRLLDPSSDGVTQSLAKMGMFDLYPPQSEPNRFEFRVGQPKPAKAFRQAEGVGGRVHLGHGEELIVRDFPNGAHLGGAFGSISGCGRSGTERVDEPYLRLAPPRFSQGKRVRVSILQSNPFGRMEFGQPLEDCWTRSVVAHEGVAVADDENRCVHGIRVRCTEQEMQGS